MLNTLYSPHKIKRLVFTIASSIAAIPAAQALEVTSGQFIQTVYPEALLASSTFSVNDFFNDEALIGRLRNDLKDDVILGPAPLAQLSFNYAVHGADFIEGHANRNPGINSFSSQFTFTPDDVLANATAGRIGLGGVMRFSLPARANGTLPYFMLGDWTLEYDQKRTQVFNLKDDPNKPINPADANVSGWFMRNHIDFPAIAYDIVGQTIMTNADAFYLSGELAWAPEMITAFFPDSELYRPVSKFVLCAQDDNALAAQTEPLIACVFPAISLNGQTGQARIHATEPMQLSVDLGVATQDPRPADYFVAFVYQDQFYWLNQDFQWSTTQSPAYQGPLLDFRNITLPSPAQIIGPLNAGTEIPFYFGVDLTQNGVFDAPYRYTHVTVQVQ